MLLRSTIVLWLVWCPIISSQSAGPPTEVNTRESGASTTLNAQDSKRLITVGDVIQMTRFQDFNTVYRKDGGAQISPDGLHFVITLNKGNTKNNRNEYSLLLFRTDKAGASPKPDVLVSLSSSSNRPAIQSVEWITNRTIAFLGEHPGEHQQLYTVDCYTKNIRQLTDHSTSLISYAVTANGSRFFFTAEQPAEMFVNDKTQREGLLISSQSLSDLMSLQGKLRSERHQDLFVQQLKSDRESLIRTAGAIGPTPLWLSPDGRYLIVQTFLCQDPPEKWNVYTDPQLQAHIQVKRTPGEYLLVSQLELIATDSDQSQPLVNAPLGSWNPEVAWAPDSKSVVVSPTFLPLTVSDPAELKTRQSSKFVAEIKVPGREIIPITDEKVAVRQWNPRSGNLLLETTNVQNQGNSRQQSIVAYCRGKPGWKRVECTPSDLSQGNHSQITLQEGLNTPPRLFSEDLKTGQKSLLIDPNPQFAQLRFGHVDDIAFRATDGHIVKAGLYLPPDYAAGERYPLVIQTHGWDPQQFWAAGPFSTAFAAQPLAAKGFVVAQLEEDYTRIQTPGEVPYEAAAYEGVIDYLDGRELIDRGRVGIIAFSRTGLGVEYTLAFSQYRFAAASLADTSDAGYFRYLALLNTSDAGNAADNERINGGAPLGDGLPSWTRNSADFNLARVITPVRIEANQPASLLFVWEWFVGLNHLKKPVDLIYIPDGTHILVKPWDRIVSQQGNVDWFCFWLKGEEDPDPAKADQYARWRELRKLQEQNKKKSANAASPPSN